MPALDEALPEIYEELRRLARRVGGRGQDRTVQATALVHEVYLKLAEHTDYTFSERAQVLGLAARAMRQVLADQARSRGRHKRGSNPLRVTFAEELAGIGPRGVDAAALHQALDQLEAVDPQALRIVELRYLAGLSVEETAASLGISTATVKRDSAVARAFLLRQLAPGSLA